MTSIANPAPIPLVDLKAAHAEVAEAVAAGMADVIARTAFVGGSHVVDFERAYADYIGVSHVIGVASGTDALEVPLRAIGVQPGDEVIVPANSFIATAEAVVRAGGVATYADVTDDALIDVASVEAAITPRTVGIAPVHLYGQMPDMAALEAVAAKHGLFILEDAAQSQGAAQDGRAAGTIGRAAGTSFYPGKNLGAYGDAGAVLTNDEEIARRSRLMGNHGSAVRYMHEIFGFNSRLDTLQAVVLNAKLAVLEQANERRRAAAARYQELLADLDEVVLPRAVPGNIHVWHLFVVQVTDRDEVLKHLNGHGIGAGLHYPVPLHLTPALADPRFPAGSFPTTERMAGTILSLPIFPQITPSQQERVVATLRGALRG